MESINVGQASAASGVSAKMIRHYEEIGLVTIARAHVDELKRKIAELQSMVAALEHLERHCHGDERPDCPILEDLEGHGPSGERVETRAAR